MHSADLLEKLNAVDESMRIEAKRASELGKSVVGAEAEACNRELATLPPELATLLATLKDWARADALRHVIVRLCAWVPLTVEQLATLPGKGRAYLRNKHLPPIVRDGQLRFRYPESAKHLHQAYVALVDTEEKP